MLIESQTLENKQIILLNAEKKQNKKQNAEYKNKKYLYTVCMLQFH